MVHWLRFPAASGGGLGSLPVVELRPCMLHSVAKKKKNGIVYQLAFAVNKLNSMALYIYLADGFAGQFSDLRFWLIS